MNYPDILAVAVTLFFVIDPLGNIPVFNAVLARFDARTRSRIMARELTIALAILLMFLFVGNPVMKFVGLTQPTLSLSGGILLFIIALRMIFPRPIGAEDDSRSRGPVHRPPCNAVGSGAVDDRDPAVAVVATSGARLGMVSRADTGVDRSHGHPRVLSVADEGAG